MSAMPATPMPAAACHFHFHIGFRRRAASAV
jgi:hypothetical protein